jgi:hypothetical protein
MEEQNSLEIWMSTDELRDAVFSLRIVSEFLDKVASEALYWKWIFITLHNALQSLMVAILRYPLPGGVASKRRTKKIVLQKMTDYFDISKREQIINDPEPLKMAELADFMELYENLKSHRVDGVTLGEPFEPDAKIEESIRALHDWRNTFTHFIPGGKLLSALERLRIVPGCIAFA